MGNLTKTHEFTRLKYMKQLLTIFILLFIGHLTFGQKSEIETKFNDIPLKVVKKGRLVDYDVLNQSKNKIVIIEFWETWCGACIEGMPHLKNLKDKFPNDLIVICISSDGFKKTVDFINKNSYPFDFIFDEQKKVSNIFPHSMKPFSIIIDKNGKVQAETHPSYIDEPQINQMLLGNAIDVPYVKNFNPNDLGNKKAMPSLVSFELLNHELGEKGYSSLTTENIKKRIVTGYAASAFIDTTETITEYITSGKNILQLYQFAYDDIAESRFLFTDNLNYIKSNTPNNLYKLNYTISNLFGDFNTVLIRQLNGVLGLETEKIGIDTTVLILKKVEINGNSIKLANPQNGKSMNTRITNYEFFEVSGNQIDLHELVRLIADKTQKLVELDMKDDLSYELKIAMDKPTFDIDDWINYFQKEGLYLTKERRRIEFIKIKKAAHNTAYK